MNKTDPLDSLIELAFSEDLADRGDVTSQAFIDPSHRSTGGIVSRQDCVVSGLRVVDRVFKSLDPKLKRKVLRKDGSAISSGTTIYTIEGRTQSILTAERIALNFLQRLSGCATMTRRFCRLVEHTRVKLLDTRKTTPGWRFLEKEAVAHGGGTNHRMGLYDAVMIKDNHLAANSDSRSIRQQIAALREKYPKIPVIIEADHLSQVDDFLAIPGVDRILLDNMNLRQLRAAVRRRDDHKKSVELEASGGVNIRTVKSIAETGVDYISIGALTHSIPSVDFGLDLQS